MGKIKKAKIEIQKNYDFKKHFGLAEKLRNQYFNTKNEEI